MAITFGQDISLAVSSAVASVGIRGYSQAQISITHPSPAEPIAVVGTGSEDINPSSFDANYIDVLNRYQSTRVTGAAFTVLADGRVQVNQDGAVIISGYADIAHSANNATVGVVFTVERASVRTLTARTVHSKMPNAGDIGHLSGDGSTDLLAGDIVGLAVASSSTGNVDIRSSSLVFEYYG